MDTALAPRHRFAATSPPGPATHASTACSSPPCSTGIYCRRCARHRHRSRATSLYYSHRRCGRSCRLGRPCLRCRPELAPQAQRHWPADRAARTRPDPWRLPSGAARRGPRAEDRPERASCSACSLNTWARRRRRSTPPIACRWPLATADRDHALPVTDVALAAGYNSLRRFNTAFLQGCGMAPTALRRQHQPLAADDGYLSCAWCIARRWTSRACWPSCANAACLASN